MNILFVTYGLPFPPTSGARIRDFNLITRVACHHRVSVLSLLETPGELEGMDALREHCEYVDGVVADRSAPATAAIAVGGLFRGRPLATAPYFYPELARRIRTLSSRQDFDLLQIEHSFLAPYHDSMASSFKGVTVLSLHNIGVQQYRSVYEMSTGRDRIPAWLKFVLMRGWEARAVRRFDRTIVVSDADRRRLEELGVSAQPNVIDNGVDTEQLKMLPPPAGNPELLFIGTQGYPPNRDAMEYFCRDVFPVIRATRPDCRLTIAGPGGREHLAHLEQAGAVEVTGRIEDPVEYYQRASVAIAPLRSGGGSRLKILEAMALGRPVVSSTPGCDGLELAPGVELLIGDDPQSFARQVLRLLDDPELWQSVCIAARRKVESRYDWERAAASLLELYAELQSGRARTLADPPWLRFQKGDAIPRLSVIIPVYNAEYSLGQCLDALQGSTLRDFELIVVDDCSTDASAEIARARCNNFIQMEKNSGAAAARNRGSQNARADLLFFLDADVLVEPDTLERVLQVFGRHPDISATFCSYQHDTPVRNFFSQYKNLLHHYTHQISGREAITFCGGYGAIYRKVFLELGGFDETHRAMEDVELGYRLHGSGHRILLSPEIQLTHTKHYTLAGLIRSDVLQRAVPWTRVMLQRRVFRSDLNLRPNNLLSTLVVLTTIIAPLFVRPVWAWEGGLLALLVALNLPFLSFLQRMRGIGFAVRAVPMIWLQYAYSGLGVALGLAVYLRDRLRQGSVANGMESP